MSQHHGHAVAVDRFRQQRRGLEVRGWSLSNLIALLRHQLFVYRDLTAWLDAPFEGPPALADIDAQQLALDWRR